MYQLTWSWLCAPYAVCTALLVAVGATAALIRGDRVLRLGMIGAAASTLPWSVCTLVAACVHDPVAATRLLRLGDGSIALVGPDLLLVILGASGQLERYRWVARTAALVGVGFVAACWLTPWTVPGVHALSSGMFVITPGPLTPFHFAQLVGWLVVGMVIARRSAPRGERRRVVARLVAILGLGVASAADLLQIYGVVDGFPFAWLAAAVASAIALYLMTRTDFLRSRGFDRGALIELIGLTGATAVIVYVTLAAPGGAPLALAMVGAVTWVIATGAAWAFVRRRPVSVFGERRLGEFVAQAASLRTEQAVIARLADLWRTPIGVEVRGAWRVDGDERVSITGGGQTRPLAPGVAAWLVALGEPLAVADLATMRLGALRPALEELVGSGDRALLVPLVDRTVLASGTTAADVDRDALVGLVECEYGRPLRENERGFVAESARAAARRLTFVALAREATREGETAREVEVAEAMRLQTAAARDGELGRWSVAAAYRSATRTTGAGWSAALLGDGRLALMVTEAQAHGVAAALATAALTGAFAAATVERGAPLTLDELLAGLGAGTTGVVRGGEPLAAFVAILDGAAGEIEYGCAGHHGGHIVAHVGEAAARPTPVTLAGRGRAPLPADGQLVVASSALRGASDVRWTATLRELAPLGARLAALAVDRAASAGAPAEDLLAVVVRRRATATA